MYPEFRGLGGAGTKNQFQTKGERKARVFIDQSSPGNLQSEKKWKNLPVFETSDMQTSANALYRKCGFVGIKQEVIDGYNCTWYEKKFRE
jgi:hypothetical protein